MVFLKIKLHLQLLSKVSPSTIFFLQHSFFLQFNHQKTNNHSISDQLNFWSLSFQFYESYVCKLSALELNAPKKAIIPTFSGQTPNFLGKNHKTRTNNKHRRKAGSYAVILSLRVGVQHIQKVREKNQKNLIKFIYQPPKVHRNFSKITFLSTFLFNLFEMFCWSYLAPHLTLKQ